MCFLNILEVKGRNVFHSMESIDRSYPEVSESFTI